MGHSPKMQLFPHIFVWGSCFWFCTPAFSCTPPPPAALLLHIIHITHTTLLTHLVVNLSSQQLANTHTHNSTHTSHNSTHTTLLTQLYSHCYLSTQLVITQLVIIHLAYAQLYSHTLSSTCSTPTATCPHNLSSHNLSSYNLLTHNSTHKPCRQLVITEPAHTQQLGDIDLLTQLAHTIVSRGRRGTW